LELFEPSRWGLCQEAILDLGVRLRRFWQCYRACFQTRTREASQQAYTYLRALLTLPADRNFKNIDRRLTGGDGQAVQHFMSNSPWQKAAVFRQIQTDLTALPCAAQGSVLILDESADARAGLHSAGAARQRNGRLGKVDVCQVGVTLAYANVAAGLWTLADGELYLTEDWFGPAYADQRQALGVPPERTFQRKIDLGLQMLERAQAQGLPFERLVADAFYGRDRQFRADLQGKSVRYAADVPANTQVYLRKPRVGVPRKRQPRGPTPRRWKVLSGHVTHQVKTLARSKRTRWQRMRVRPTERGWLEADFAVLPVWTITDSGQVRAEWLVIRRDLSGEFSYTLLNDPPDTPAPVLIAASCLRYFTERVYEDAKGDLGWGEFQAQKYQAWEHHLALTGLALWFVADTKLQWAQTYARDPQLKQQLELELLPALSTANVCELLRAVLPLPTFTPEDAIHVVIQMLVDRARSTRSRLKAQTQRRKAPT
jgi:SRSO17 transposase